MRFKLLFLLLAPLLLSACAGAFSGGGWQASTLQQQHIRALAVNPNNVHAIYAGDAHNGIFESTDAGQHWSQRNTGLPQGQAQGTAPTFPAIAFLSFDASGKKLYAASDRGIFVSADGGQHWDGVGAGHAGLPKDSYTALSVDFNAAHTLYVAAAHSGVYVSKDDGSSWSHESGGGLPPDLVIYNLAVDSRHRLWAATDQGIYRSSDGGATWQPRNNGLPPAIVVYTVQPADVAGGPQGLIYTGTNHGFFRSQDDGARWTVGQETFARIGIRAILIDFRQGQGMMFYIATDVGAFRSSDGGETWGAVAPGLPRNQHVYALALGSDGYSQLYAAADNVYLYPGSNAGFSVTNLLPILVVLLCFYLLYRFTGRGRRGSREMLKPERIIETPGRTPPKER